jgi:hypothetical protein
MAVEGSCSSLDAQLSGGTLQNLFSKWAVVTICGILDLCNSIHQGAGLKLHVCKGLSLPLTWKGLWVEEGIMGGDRGGTTPARFSLCDLTNNCSCQLQGLLWGFRD